MKKKRGEEVIVAGSCWDVLYSASNTKKSVTEIDQKPIPEIHEVLESKKKRKWPRDSCQHPQRDHHEKSPQKQRNNKMFD